MPKESGNRATARTKVARMRAEQARRRRRRNWIIAIGSGLVAIGAVVGIVLAATSGSPKPPATSAGTPQLRLASLGTLGALKPLPSPGPAGPEGVPVPAAPPLAGLATAATGAAIDGIQCQTSEQVLFHIHAHLTIFVNGVARQVPAAVGIPGAQGQNTPRGVFISGGSCFYWLHTHSADGIIHIESPVHRTYTLGEFFSEWGQPLSASQVGPAHGKVTALYNGKVYLGNPAGIPLTRHAQIQLEVGTPLIVPETVTFPGGL